MTTLGKPSFVKDFFVKLFHKGGWSSTWEKFPHFPGFFLADVPNWKKYQSSCLELKVGYRCREVVDCWQEWFWNEERRRGDEKRRMRRRRGKDRRRLWSRLRKAAPHPSEQWVLKMILDVANNGKQWKAWLIHKDCKQSSLLLCQTVPQTSCEPSVSGNLISICKVSRRLFQACESARLACLKKTPLLSVLLHQFEAGEDLLTPALFV